MSTRSVSTILALLFGLVLNAAAAASPSRLYVFGDSLSDNGNLAALTSQASGGLVSVPFSNYWNGRISNGPNWVDYFAAENASIPVTNFAVAGAYTGSYLGSDNSLDGDLSSVPVLGAALAGAAIGLGTELTFMPNVSGTNSAAVLWIGANDILSARSNGYADASGAVSAALNNVGNAITSLETRGLSDIYVANLPDIGRTPRAIANAQQAEFTQAVVSFNQGLASIVSGAGSNVKIVDIFTAFNFMLANAGPLGFTNTTQGCISGASDFNICSDGGAARVFWDDVHPTTLTHLFLAKAFEQAIVPVPVPAALPLLVSGLLLLSRTRRRA